MNQSRGLDRLSRRLSSELLGRESSQLVIDQREELLGGSLVAVLDSG